MATLFSLLILLCGSLANAQQMQEVVNNFQVASKNSTHITFSWDIVDGYYNSSYINHFEIHYRERFGCASSITEISNFYCFGQIIMWVTVSRNSFRSSAFYSKQLQIELGQKTSIEVNIRLRPSQRCQEFIVLNTQPVYTYSYSAVQSEVYWIILKYCQCNIQNVRLSSGYFTCAAGGYVTFRVNILSINGSADVKSALTTWLYGQDTNKTFIIYGMQYSVEAGPCGLTVPDLYAPQCSTPDTLVASNSTQDNTAVIVASVFAAMFFILALGLIGYIIAARRRQTTPSTDGRVARATTRPSNAPDQAATRREQPKVWAKPKCELKPRYHIEDPDDQIYTEMEI